MNQPTLRPAPRHEHYEVVRDFAPQAASQDVVVPKFFRYDGASIPPLAWQFTYTPFHPDVMAAAVVHDWIYYNHQMERDEADDLFYELLRASGVNLGKAMTMYFAVKQFGELFWENDADDLRFLATLCGRLQGRPNFERYRFPVEVRSMCCP